MVEGCRNKNFLRSAMVSCSARPLCSDLLSKVVNGKNDVRSEKGAETRESTPAPTSSSRAGSIATILTDTNTDADADTDTDTARYR